MKNLLKTFLFTLILSGWVLSLSATQKKKELQLPSGGINTKIIIVTGNARVYLIQSDAESVDLDQEDLKKVSIYKIGNELHIGSSGLSPVTVMVYVKDIFRIDASNTSVVKTEDRLKVDYLQVMLKDNAVAKINIVTKSLYTEIEDQTRLELTGSANEHIVSLNGHAKLESVKFAALVTSLKPEAGTYIEGDNATESAYQ